VRSPRLRGSEEGKLHTDARPQRQRRGDKELAALVCRLRVMFLSNALLVLLALAGLRLAVPAVHCGTRVYVQRCHLDLRDPYAGA
jgi:hypothetical protein